MTFPPDFQVPWAGHAGVTLITLSRLDRAESAHLAGLLAPELPPMLLDRIALRADGVPLYIEDLTKDWVERAHDPDSALQTLRVPTTLQGSLLARLDRLPDAKQVARGRRGDRTGVLLRADQHGLRFPGEGVRDRARAVGLVRIDPLSRRASLGPSTGFKHARVQRAVYSTLLRTLIASRHTVGSLMPSGPVRMSSHRPWPII